MSGHIDIQAVVRAPLELTWRLANSTENDRRHAPDGHHLVAEDPARHSRTLRVVTPPDDRGRVWEYYVERVLDPERHTAYSRRYGNPGFRYSVALWAYQETPDGGSLIRTVQDFETTPESPVDDHAMGEIIRRGTEGALRRTVEFVEAEHARRTSG